jgi:hypothetical protein
MQIKIFWPNSADGYLNRCHYKKQGRVFALHIQSSIFNLQSSIPVYPNVAKVGGLQSQGVKGENVVGYLDPLTTQDLKSSGFPIGLTTWQSRPHP